MHPLIHVLIAAALVAPGRASHRRPEAKVALSKTVEGKREKPTKVARVKRRPHRPALSGEAKAERIDAIAAAIGSSDLTIAKVYTVSATAVSDEVGLEIAGAAIYRDESSTAAPELLVSGRVGMRLPGKVGRVYLFDCGVSGTREVRFNILENGASFASGTTAPALDRLIFAHAFSHDADTRLLVNFVPEEAGERYRFSGCEVTELVPASRATHAEPATEAAASF